MARNPTELFDKLKIEKICSKIKLTNEQKDAAKEWIGLLEADKLEKEKENQPKFEQIVLQRILGYTIYDYTPEKEFIDYTIDDVSSGKSLCMEVKGTGTKDLFAYQSRGKKDKENPIAQTWTYMGQGYDYGVCSNYKEFILLSKDVGTKKVHKFNFLSIKLSENRLDENKLREFVGIFSKEEVFINNSIEHLTKESQLAEQEFTDEFYKLFHETRLMLIKEFEQPSDVSREDAIHWAQIFLNRLIFIFFVEDHNFIPDKLFAKRINGILESPSIDESTQKIHEDILGLFKIMNKGSDVRRVYGFNGGLFGTQIPSNINFLDLRDSIFFEDEFQNSKLSIKSLAVDISTSGIYGEKLSPIIKNLLIMDSYDFTSDLNVNILGHIFEQSITDVESLHGDEISKRKKHGVFYTPDYITDHICRNTIIPYLSKTDKISVIELVDEYSEKLEELETKIKNLKILDPACGSGAFLVKSVDILLEIDEEIQLRKPQDVSSQKGLEEFTKTRDINLIIENNIYGVDINEESIEITKLSLFLKLAGPRNKLSYLSNNIKHGNSLIDDKKIDEKAFSWENEFPEILGPLIEKKGFDVIIGNPPYVKNTILSQIQKSHFMKFESAKKQYDLYVLFLEQGLSKLATKGKLGFIVPNKLLSADYSTKLRNILLRETTIDKIVDISDLSVFKNASTYPIILLLSKNISIVSSRIGIIFCDNEYDLEKKPDYSILQSEFNKNENKVFLIHANPEIDQILKKIENQSEQLSKFYKIRKGIETGKDKERTFFSESKPIEKFHKPVLGANTLKRYSIDWNNRYIIYDSQILSGARKPEYFEIPKIITGRTVKRLSFCLDLNNFYTLDTTQILFPIKEINQLNILGLINSKLINFYYSIQFKDSHMRGGYVRCYTNFLEKIPIHNKVHNINEFFSQKVQEQLDVQTKILTKKRKFLNNLIINFSTLKLSKKVENFFNLQFIEFLKEIKIKSGIKLSLEQQDEWSDYFESYKKQILELKSKLICIDKEIDELVYEMYNLTEYEISLIEKT